MKNEKITRGIRPGFYVVNTVAMRHKPKIEFHCALCSHHSNCLPHFCSKARKPPMTFQIRYLVQQNNAGVCLSIFDLYLVVSHNNGLNIALICCQLTTRVPPHTHRFSHSAVSPSLKIRMIVLQVVWPGPVFGSRGLRRQKVQSCLFTNQVRIA